MADDLIPGRGQQWVNQRTAKTVEVLAADVVADAAVPEPWLTHASQGVAS